MEWTRSDQLAAPIELVWQLTIDIDRWPEILPTVQTVTRLDPDPLAAGSRVRIEQPGLTAEWTVQVLEPDHRFIWATEWRGRPLVAEHHLQAAGESTVNTLRLRLGGAPSPLLRVTLGPLMRMTLAREARAFRRAAERAGP